MVSQRLADTARMVWQDLATVEIQTTCAVVVSTEVLSPTRPIVRHLHPAPTGALPYCLPYPTSKGLRSPLPPIEVLRKLRRLITDEKNIEENRGQRTQICWSLLRRSVLMSLAGVIGADGRGGDGGVWQGQLYSAQVSVES